VLVHVIFSTKHRTPWLAPAVRKDLYPYLAATLSNHGSPCLQIGGVEDHVHVLLNLSRTMTVAQVVEKAKTSTSKWAKTHVPDFAWQAGYGAFSVSAGDVNRVTEYIRSQEAHHQKFSFQEEYRNLLLELGVDFDERFLWD
jgi:putative transposase